MIRTLPLLILLAIPSLAPAQPATGTLSGRVADETGAALPGAVIYIRAEDGLVTDAVADDGGGYRVERLAAGRYVVEFRLPNFAAVRRADVVIAAGETRELDATLALTLSADVLVTGTRTFSNLADLDAPVDGLIGIADSASEGLVSGRQIQQRPIMRAGEVIESVPGVIISQHSGEGKANHYYLRGFNLDHGTDFATSVAGVPVNMPTHAHGHGYSDLNFLIPELVGGVQFRKGPYFAEDGDFSSAGSAHIRYLNVLDAPIVRVSGGEDGWGRVLAAASPRVGRGHLLVAVEANHNDGPWVQGDDYEKLNGVVRYTLGDARDGLSVTAMGYDGSWRATDQAPARAIGSGLISRFDGIDDSVGGDTFRFSLSSEWQRTRSASVTRASAYAMRYTLDLFSNFTYFLDDPENGDQFQQSDRRVVGGGRVSHRMMGWIGGRASELLVGADVRHDAIGRVALLHTSRRTPISSTRDDERWGRPRSPATRSTSCSGRRGCVRAPGSGSIASGSMSQRSSLKTAGPRPRAWRAPSCRSSSGRGSRPSSTPTPATGITRTTRAARPSPSIRPPGSQPIGSRPWRARGARKSVRGSSRCAASRPTSPSGG